MANSVKMGMPTCTHVRISGEKIKPEQAKEIIMRTDNFFMEPWSENKQFDERMQEVFQLPKPPKDVAFKQSIQCGGRWRQFYCELATWQNEHNYIELSHFQNQWIKSDSRKDVGGWCHPDGTIFYFGGIGGRPTVRNMIEECKRIAREFMFLNACVLILEEIREKDQYLSLFSIIINKGEVKIEDPLPSSSSLSKTESSNDFTQADFMEIFREWGIIHN